MNHEVVWKKYVAWWWQVVEETDQEHEDKRIRQRRAAKSVGGSNRLYRGTIWGILSTQKQQKFRAKHGTEVAWIPLGIRTGRD